TGVGALDYPASGYIRIGSEVCSFTRSSDVLTIVRGLKGTAATEHKLGDTVQLCKEYVGQTVQNIVYDLLVNFCGVYSGYLDLINWNAEQTAYLTRLYSALITAPTGVSKLLTELCEQVGFLLFWDEVNEKLILKSVRPNSLSETVTDLTADYHLLADSLKLKDLNDERVNEAWIYYGLIDFTKNLEEEANYKLLYVAANVSDQSTNKNRDIRIKKIFSRWIIETAKSAARELANKYLERFAVAPVEANFSLDAKDGSLALADFVRINSRQYQDFYGNNQDLLLQIVKRKEALVGTTWAFTARQFAFSNGYEPRDVYISANKFDLNLKTEHDLQYGTPPSAGDIVNIIIESGVLVSSTSTATYALVNPNTWASGVIINLIIESGAIVAGRGGTGGTGSIFGDGNGSNGNDGGVAFLMQSPISVENNGVISGGAGGGGGGGGGKDGFLAGLGGGGGGGWPYGSGGLGGDYGYGASGNDGSIASTNGGAGGAGGRSSSGGDFGQGGAGGTGGDIGQNGLVGGTGAGEDFGFGGTGGALGDAIHGNSYITWVATGTRYGAIV
ncbi:MAG: hypothetical protein WAT41_14320, partial [Flavobacteriales bacterium]